MAEEKTVTLRQNSGERLALEHDGGVALYGGPEHQPLQHRLSAQVVHVSDAKQPLVHMVTWDEDCACEITGRVALVGDEKAPLRVSMSHHFENDHRQSHRIETRLSEPIHHALQMRTPLQVRFCNPWHVASDYTMEIRMGDNRVISVRLTGATVATPQPCPDDKPCAPVNAQPDHP
ncbi:MAG: hypothetical protein IT531_16200 [Burkholderiales bacterium]|nr:hypothetical protein [Burkholderiales bacterium]